MAQNKVQKAQIAISPEEALDRLKLGNERFVKNLTSVSTLNHQERREKWAAAQNPFAIILSCSDSRVPSEMVFDQGLGDLFVIRVAGNIVAPSIIGSIEFAASSFGTALVVVMGHSNCGAVSAALDVETLDHGIGSENIRDIVDRITPSMRPVLRAHQTAKSQLSRTEVLDQCIKANVMASVDHLKHGSSILENLVQTKKLVIVGSEYNLDTGVVEFFDQPILSDQPFARPTPEVSATKIQH